MESPIIIQVSWTIPRSAERSHDPYWKLTRAVTESLPTAFSEVVGRHPKKNQGAYPARPEVAVLLSFLPDRTSTVLGTFRNARGIIQVDARSCYQPGGINLSSLREEFRKVAWALIAEEPDWHDRVLLSADPSLPPTVVGETPYSS